VSPAGARAIALALLLRLAKTKSPRLSMPHYHCKYPTGAAKSFDGIAEFLTKEPLDRAAYYLSCVYAFLCDPDERRDLAMYFTPPSLARHIIAIAAREAGAAFTALRFMDPACGGAAFLLPVAIKLRTAMLAQGFSAGKIIRAVNRQVIGVEKDATLAELCRQFIRIALAKELTESRQTLGSIVRVDNALSLLSRGQLPRVNVLLCNPPYRKIRASELSWFRHRFPEVIFGQPNLYTMFMRAAIELVIPGGLIALLTPTSYFSGPTYERIRSFITWQTSILRIDLVHERDNLFLGVQHDVAVLLARRRLTRPAQQSAQVFTWHDCNGWESLGAVALPNDGGAWHLPRDAVTARALVQSKSSSSSLAEYGYRPRVGVYVWNRDPRRTRKVRPRGRDRKLAVPVIWATQIGQDGQFHFISKSRKEKRARYILLRPDNRGGVFTRDCVLLQRTSSRGQHQRLVAAALPRGFAKRHSGFVGENHVIILEPINQRPLVPRRTLVRLLNSEHVSDLYSTTTGTTAVTVAGLNDLPLPDPQILKRLIKRQPFALAVRSAFATSSMAAMAKMPDAKAARF
jgi:adenine-specific DNA-methyltransferase